MSIINSCLWTPKQVAEWITGLETVSSYSDNFLRGGVTGQLLVNLQAGDLSKFGVHKVGDQLLFQDAISTLRNELDIDRTTLQTLASSLAIRCRNYRSELSSLLTPTSKQNYIPTESLSSASYLLDAAKFLIRWLTRFPFIGNAIYDDITVKLTKFSFDLAILSQRDSFADYAIEEVQYLCTKLIEICETLINSKDSLILVGCALDQITLRKRNHDQDLGLYIESTCFGVHQVAGVKLTSPAQQSGHLERGDEILQVNYHTVVGWPLSTLTSMLSLPTPELLLTIKRRPRHATTHMLGPMYLRPKPPPIEEKVPPQPTTHSSTKITPKPAAAAERFWKLYLRPRNLIKRRATVTGASPTNTRPPVTFLTDTQFKRPPLVNSKSAPDKILLRKQNNISEESKVRQSLPVFQETLTVEDALRVPLFVVPAAPDPQETSPSVQQPERPQSKPEEPQVETRPPADVSSPLVKPEEVIPEAEPVVSGIKTAPSDPSPYGGVLHLRQLQSSSHTGRWTRNNSKYTGENLEIGKTIIELASANVSLANEVHSRPFAFKIEQGKDVYYLAAESQQEYEIWLSHLNSSLLNQPLPAKARPLYKRSISLGNSPRSNPPMTPSRSSKRSSVQSRTNSIRNEWLGSHDTRQTSSTTKLDQASNISSITITSRKKDKPLMGLQMLKRRSCSCSSDERIYRDTSTQTELNSILLFLNEQEESRV